MRVTVSVIHQPNQAFGGFTHKKDMAVGFRPDPHPLGSSLHSFRQDFEDHKDTGEEERGERKNSVSEWDRKGKGHVVVK